MADQLRLRQAIPDASTRRINHHYGRPLLADDLTQDQASHIARADRHATVHGSGVVSGLRVRWRPAEGAVVRVTPGWALTAAGRPLVLKNEVVVSLSAPAAAPPAPLTRHVFSPCGPPIGDAALGGAPSIGVLSICPVDILESRSPLIDTSGARGQCTWRYRVDGAEFRLSMISRATIERRAGQSLAAPRTQSRLAGLLLDGDRPLGRTRDPLGERAPGLDAVSLGLVDDCSVPLAVIYWSDGLVFVDEWIVRRQPAPSPTSRAVDGFSGTTDLRVGEARFQQFQAHLQTLLETADGPLVSDATRHFGWLPPVGLLPLAPRDGRAAVDWRAFFATTPTREPIWLEGAQVETLVRHALHLPPIRTTARGEREVIWLYRVRENAVDASPSASAMLFTSGHIEPHGTPRVDLARIDYATLLT